MSRRVCETYVRLDAGEYEHGICRHTNELRQGAERSMASLALWPLNGACDLDGSFDGVANSLADLIDRQTCNDVGDRWTFRCSVCGCELDLEDREGEPTMWFEGSAMTPRHCPNCGAVVLDEEETDAQ